MRGQNLGAALAPLEGKRVRIRLTDAPLQLNLCIAASRLKVAAAHETPHVTVRGRLADFVRLASRTEDPDTLFFQRRLSLEGETETGLAIKNALDALDWNWRRHCAAILPPRAAQALRALSARLPRPPLSPLRRNRAPR
ncbi:MAG: SCP2 sterol-binding domain-containing protein [Pseudomonadota bacterium]|nr:SCP2 sterol-binding domain-containing protein [Pseudomonadota bacterium]